MKKLHRNHHNHRRTENLQRNHNPHRTKNPTNPQTQMTVKIKPVQFQSTAFAIGKIQSPYRTAAVYRFRLISGSGTAMFTPLAKRT